MARKENPVIESTEGSLPPGARLRLARRERGLSLGQLASELGYSKPYLSAVENGGAPPSAAILAAYERVLSPLPPSALPATLPPVTGGSLDQEIAAIAAESGMATRETSLLRSMLIDDARTKARTLRASLDWWSTPGSVPVCCIPVAGWQWHEWPSERIVAAINRAAAEAMQARIRELVIILPPEKIPEMERAFQRSPFAERLQQFTCVAQPVALGLGHAITLAQPAVGPRPFALLLPDDQFDRFGSETSVLRSLVDQHATGLEHIVAVAKLKDHRGQYGVARLEAGSSRRHRRSVELLVEKPDAAHPVFQRDRPSDPGAVYAVVGRYVLSPSILTALGALAREQPPGTKVELLNALQWLIDRGQSDVAAYVLPSLVQLDRDQTVFVAGSPAATSGISVA